MKNLITLLCLSVFSGILFFSCTANNDELEVLQAETQPVLIDLTEENFYDYLKLEISLENWNETSARNILGFTDWTYTANIRIKCSPIKDRKFEDAKFTIRWNLKNEINSSLYDKMISDFNINFSNRTEFILDTSGNAEISRIIRGQFLTSRTPPHILLEDFYITIISGTIIE